MCRPVGMSVKTDEPVLQADLSVSQGSIAPDAPAPPGAGPALDWLRNGRATLDPSKRIVQFNEQFGEWLGATSGLLTGARFDELLEKRVLPGNKTLGALWAEAVPWAETDFAIEEAGRKQWYHIEIEQHAAGWSIRLNSILPPLRQLLEEGGAAHRGEDDEKRELRLRLLRTEAQLENLIQRWPGVIFTQRADFSFQYVSGKIEELTGVSPEEWRKQPRRFWDLVHEVDVDELRRSCRQASRKPPGTSTTFRIRHLLTGKVSYILEHRQASVSSSGIVLGYQGVWLDVTRQTLAEKRLSSAAWKETLALLTMGLAHDFTNQLSGILSLTELLQRSAPGLGGPELEMIKQSAIQSSQLVRRIVNLHRSKSGAREYLDLNLLVSELVDLIRKVLPRRIQVEMHAGSDPMPVYIDGVEFRQVVLNLALNAADAMPNRGVLSLRVSAQIDEQPLVHGQGQFPRLPAVCLSVQDNGHGISARHLPHVFDPFFTTKLLAKGSGLGLYNARRFVEEHQGAISVESTEGAGTTFHLWLPRADFTEAERAVTRSASERRSVLIVGRPGGVVETVAEFLRTHNFYVVATHAPQRAIELLSTEAGSLQGVIVLAEPNDAQMLDLVSQMRDRGLARRVILQIVGGNSDQVDTALLTKANLVLTEGADDNAFLERIHSLFAQDPTK